MENGDNHGVVYENVAWQYQTWGAEHGVYPSGFTPGKASFATLKSKLQNPMDRSPLRIRVFTIMSSKVRRVGSLTILVLNVDLKSYNNNLFIYLSKSIRSFSRTEEYLILRTRISSRRTVLEKHPRGRERAAYQNTTHSMTSSVFPSRRRAINIVTRKTSRKFLISKCCLQMPLLRP